MKDFSPRKAAVLSLNSSIKNGKYSNLELDAAIKKYGFEDKDKAFFTRLFYGTVERKITLDYIIRKLSTVKFEKIEPLVLCVLETGLYQVFFMDKVPDSAACNESTELVKTTCPKAYAGFVNGIMRSAVRQKKELLEEISALKGSYGLSIKYSVPEWLCKMWEQNYGESRQIVKALSKVKVGVALRVNTLRISAKELLDKLPSELEAKAVGNTSIIIPKSCVVTELYGYDEGLFFVQDPASTIVSSLVNKTSVKKENPVIVDTCSCPGGKSFSMAINLENKAKIYSMDLHESRLKLVRSGAERLGITCIETHECDGRKPKEELFGTADVVLCDVPCSGLGVIAKKPDIRYKTYEEIEKLPDVQKSILEASKNYLKDDGFIIYSTCTLRKAENEEVVSEFLKNNKDFELCPTGIFGDETGMVTFLPHKTGTDGFFAAKLRKKK
ncbi:MAG: 16S rRNA (cytosine(967)-C(5))-methyltransferase RsmB [Ruminococcaceae bacterium]|nr:16S rRNA (cytosine(967)-C(5))-methyltransferase RsmB [Oscillospiraceae bacterium]